jgi:hypothetical protein
MKHKENRLLARFMEIIWVFKPLYVIMEEVPDVFARVSDRGLGCGLSPLDINPRARCGLLLWRSH